MFSSRKISQWHGFQVLVSENMDLNFDSTYKSAPQNDDIEELIEAKLLENTQFELDEKEEERIKIIQGKSTERKNVYAGKHTDPVYTLKQKKKTFGTCDVSEVL